MGRMYSNALISPPERYTPAALNRLYTQTFLWYLLGVLLLWILGFEGVYANPTPFYAFLKPIAPRALELLLWSILGLQASAWAFRRWVWPRTTIGWPRTVARGLWIALLAVIALRANHADASGPFLSILLHQALALVVFFGGLVAVTRWAARPQWFDEPFSVQETRLFLTALVLFAIAFSCAVATMRGGLEGISQAYARHALEYTGDIGRGMSIRGLFHDYPILHPYLSAHGKVHPPGAIALLWLFSYGVGTEPLPLSLATIFFGSLSVIPLYLWTRNMLGERRARVCAMLYVAMPSIVLFTATSADIAFMPFTLFTLYAFWRALHEKRLGLAAAAGVGYALMSLISFSLVGIGAFFGLVGLWRLRDESLRISVVQTAAVMIVTFLGVHGLVYLWSGFDIVTCFNLCREQFFTDQAHLEELAPRFSSAAWKLFNPLCWLFFAGIPVSALAIWRWLRPTQNDKALLGIFLLTLLVLDMLYLARGEGERSAMYVMPFLAVPAACMLDDLDARLRSPGPLLATLGFLGFQCWFIEFFFYTYW